MGIAYIILEKGILQGSRFKIEGVITIGSSSKNTIQLPDPGVSLVHAQIVDRGSTCTIEDLHSENGTFVEGSRIQEVITLQNGMKVQVGSATLRYIFETEEDGRFSELDEIEELPVKEAQDIQARPRLKRLEEAIARIPIFQNLNTNERQELADLADLHIYQKGEIILREGDSGRTLYIVLDGQVRSFTLDYQGNMIVLDTMGPDRFFGVIGMLMGAPQTATIVATEESLLAEFPFQEMNEFLEHYPRIKKVFEEQSQKDLEVTAAKREKAGAKDRRIHPRFNVVLPVKFFILPEQGIEERLTEEVFRAKSKDISLSGIGLLVEDPSLQTIPRETRLKLEIEFPEKRGKIQALGTIKNRFKNEETGATFFGIQFFKLSSTGMIRLKEFLYG